MGLACCCTLHEPWIKCTVWTVIQHMGHGAHVLLYTPWCMGDVYQLYWCTPHGSWAWYTDIRSIDHGARISLYHPLVAGTSPPHMLYDPSSMENRFSTIHGLYITLTPMGHGLYSMSYGVVWIIVHGVLSRCMAHDPWEKSS